LIFDEAKSPSFPAVRVYVNTEKHVYKNTFAVFPRFGLLRFDWFLLLFCLVFRPCAQALVTLSATGLGRLEPAVRTGDGGGPSAAWPTATVCETISALERRTPSLGKGVMVVATDWSTDGDVPPAFLRTVQARDGQPVYAADVARLLADGRRGDGAPPPGPCGRPAERGRASLLLPPSARYVVLFRGRGGPTPNPFRGLAGLNYTFWGGDVYYLIVAHDFDRTVRRMVYGVWRDLSVYKYVHVFFF